MGKNHIIGELKHEVTLGSFPDHQSYQSGSGNGNLIPTLSDNDSGNGNLIPILS